MNRWDYFKILILYSLVQVVLYKSIILAFFIPLPIMILYHKYGRGLAWGSFVLAAIGVFLITGVANIYFIGFASIGLIYSEVLFKKYSLEKSFLISLGAAILVFILILIPYSLHEGGPFKYIEKKSTQLATQFSENVKNNKSFYLKLGYTEKAIDKIVTNPQRIAQKIISELPSNIMIIMILSLWLNLIIFKKIAQADIFGSLNLWKTPEKLVWPTIACGIFLVFKIEGVSIVALNIFKIILSFYFLQGIAVLAFFFNTRGFNYFFQIIIYLILVLLLVFLIIGLGFFDLWVDFRKLAKKLKPE